MGREKMVKVYEILHDTTQPGPMEDYAAVRRYGPEQRSQAREFAAKATYRGEPASGYQPGTGFFVLRSASRITQSGLFYARNRARVGHELSYGHSQTRPTQQAESVVKYKRGGWITASTLSIEGSAS